MTADAVARAHVGRQPDLIELHVFLESIEHRLRTRFDADHDAAQPRPHRFRKQLLAQTAGLIGAKRRRPGDIQPARQKLLRQRIDTSRMRKKRLVLKRQIVEGVASMQRLDLLANPFREEAGPAPCKDGRVGAEGTPKPAALP